ncbi:MAG: DoxX family protein [Oceanicaulis sp.]
MSADKRFRALYAPAAGDAAGPGASARLVCPTPPRPGETPIDLLVGLMMRAALAVQFFGWAIDNAAIDARWRSFAEPEPGLVDAAAVWTLGVVDPAVAAFALLSTALTLGALLMTGFLTRLAGLLTAAGALWHALFVLPEAWPSTLAWGALGVYLALRGAGPASLDWALARLSRLG